MPNASVAKPRISKTMALEGRPSRLPIQVPTSQPMYRKERVIFELAQGLLAQRGSQVPLRAMALAVCLQDIQTEEDRLWLSGEGVSQELAEKVLHRLIVRGGRWLEFLESLLEFSGRYADIPDLSSSLGNGHL